MLSFSAGRDVPEISSACAVSDGLACLLRFTLPDCSFVDECDERILLGGSNDPSAAEARTEAVFE
jgi:hypothetical protein